MAKYKVVNQAVEINGFKKNVDDIVDESEFRPAGEGRVFHVKEKPADMDQSRYNELVMQESEEVGEWGAPLSELDSLLKTGHVVPAE